MQFDYIIWVLFLPLASFVITGLAGNRMKPVISGVTGTVAVGLAFLIALYAGWDYFFVHGKAGDAYQPHIAMAMRWLPFTETLQIDMGLLVDPISVMMIVVVTTIAFMVHIYSFGYMAGDPGFSRFYAYLSLFTFSMLGLVVATNIFQTYVFWELVGVSSYLLIGFYYDKPSAVSAAKKAFIVTRFADLGFLIGILIISWLGGSFNFLDINDPEGKLILQGGSIAFMGFSLLTWTLLLVFMGAAGKSAMFPLHIWLPDAMEGPTPVSALIHAATMVVAGVYLVARLFPAYAGGAPEALERVAFTGAFTALFAAVIACTQKDIKRILAFSTMSQIGYMMLALGAGGAVAMGYTASMFHLFTHAFFKALLFLGAGAVIHAIHTNNIENMGGLRKHMPLTHLTFLIACLAISGIPPFAGFFSKDEILLAAFHANKVYFFTGVFVAGLTAFYMFRLYFTVFWGKSVNYPHPPHEAPRSMVIPMLFLAVGSLCAGWIPFSRFITPDGMPHENHIHWQIAVPSIVAGLAGIGVAMAMYWRPSDLPDRMAGAMKGLYRLAYDKFYIDELYLFITKKFIFKGLSEPMAWFDRHVVDGTMNLIAAFTGALSQGIRWIQTGQLQHYALSFLAGAVGLVLLILYVWTT